jgi:hypothetical protein
VNGLPKITPAGSGTTLVAVRIWRWGLGTVAVALVSTAAFALFHPLSAHATVRADGAVAAYGGSCASAWDQWMGPAWEKEDPIPSGGGSASIWPGTLFTAAMNQAVSQCRVEARNRGTLSFGLFAGALALFAAAVVPRRRFPAHRPLGWTFRANT